MSNLTETDLDDLKPLIEYPGGPGYVLDFSDRTFGQFFRDKIGVNIDDPKWERLGTSKGKRLRWFLLTVDDALARKALIALWKYRGRMLRNMNVGDPIVGSRDRLVDLAKAVGWKEPKKQAATGAAPVWDPQPLSSDQTKAFLDRLQELDRLEPHPRGFAFERFLYDLFDAAGLDPRGSFRNTGEQIDGSFILRGETYLLEAKWTGPRIAIADLGTFHSKVEAKATWARGLFVSYSGFSEDAFTALGSGKRIVCMDGLDLYRTLSEGIALQKMLDLKVRRAAETGRAYVPLDELKVA